MYFKDLIINKYNNEKVVIFVDMDGVIADYNFNRKLDFRNKRPIETNIKTLYEISLLKNVELFILSICKNNDHIEDKNYWLEKHASFFQKNNRIIISKEKKPNISSKRLKYDFLNNFTINEKNKKIIVIDDDNEILKYLSSKLDNIDLYQDSSMID